MGNVPSCAKFLKKDSKEINLFLIVLNCSAVKDLNEVFILRSIKAKSAEEQKFLLSSLFKISKYIGGCKVLFSKINFSIVMPLSLLL